MNTPLTPNQLQVSPTDLERAAQIQHNLLPREPLQNEWLDIAAHTAQRDAVGGDIHTFQTLPNGRVRVFVADVAGKGVAAALVATLCQAHLRHLQPEATDPADLLRKLNAAMQGEFSPVRYLTAICAEFDPATGTVTLARAGHELPLYYHPASANLPAGLEKIETEGLGIGLAPPDSFDDMLTQSTLPFPSGTALLFFTDGIVEATNRSGDEFGSERLEALFAESAATGANADTVNQIILSAVDAFAESAPRHDDRTLVCMLAKA